MVGQCTPVSRVLQEIQSVLNVAVLGTGPGCAGRVRRLAALQRVPLHKLTTIEQESTLNVKVNGLTFPALIDSGS